MTSRSCTVDQTSHRLLCDALRETVQVGPGAVENAAPVWYRACAVLYMLLLDHPIDRRGRCRSCRRPGALIGLRRRPCRIHLRASYWLLRQPDDALLLSHLTHLLRPGATSAPGSVSPPHRSVPRKSTVMDLRDTDVLPAVIHDPPTDPSRKPAEGSRSRRVPLEVQSLVITGGMPWPR